MVEEKSVQTSPVFAEKQAEIRRTFEKPRVEKSIGESSIREKAEILRERIKRMPDLKPRSVQFLQPQQLSVQQNPVPQYQTPIKPYAVKEERNFDNQDEVVFKNASKEESLESEASPVQLAKVLQRFFRN